MKADELFYSALSDKFLRHAESKSSASKTAGEYQ